MSPEIVPAELQNLSDLSDKDVKLVIKIHGEAYEGRIDADIATTILDVQDSIYRIAKIAAFGVAPNNRRLPAELKRKLKVQFQVNSGCTEIISDLLQACSQILTAWGGKMTPEQITELSKLLIYIVGGGIVAAPVLKHFIDRWADTKNKEIEAERETQADRDRIEYGRLIAESILESARQEGDRLVERVAKQFNNATEIEFGRRKIKSAELDMIRSRLPRSKISPQTTKGEFFVQKINVECRLAISVELRNARTGEVIRGKYMEEPAQTDDENLFEDGEDQVLKALCLAAAAGDELKILVAYRTNTNGTILSANILDVIDDAEESEDSVAAESTAAEKELQH